MKKPTKSNKGITLITLVITVIVIAILASVATYSGIEVINSSKLTRFTTEMKLIQTKVNEIYEDREQYKALGSNTNSDKLTTIFDSINIEWGYGSDTNKYKYFSKDEIKIELNIEDIQQEGVFIDFDNRKVVSANGITVDGTTYYVLEQLPNSLYNVGYEELSQVQVAKKYGNIFEQNKTITDEYKNSVTIPEGFKVSKESADTVNGGIVIEDKKGNQFVWVPVGDVYTDKERTEANKKTIELKRYVFNSDGTISEELTKINPNDQLQLASTASNYYTEATKDKDTSNSHAKDIEKFIRKANSNHGYYLGRYEAGVTNYDPSKTITSNTIEANWTGYVAQEGKSLELVCKSEQQVWNYVTRNKASELARGMYTEKTYESDLVNSYAWDTAIVFIQKCGTKTNSKTYSKQIGQSINTNELALTGTGLLSSTNKVDKQCNIYDMAGNEPEWSTETSSIYWLPAVYRGGSYSVYGSSDTCSRQFSSGSDAGISFRPILYL